MERRKRFENDNERNAPEKQQHVIYLYMYVYMCIDSNRAIDQEGGETNV